MIALSFLILSLFIVGCSSEQPHNEFLTKAEAMVFEKPDSVVRLLAPRWYDTKMDEADLALYGLLYTEALHRSGLYTEADSLIIFSRKYYKEKGDQEHLSRALLHHAIILYRQKLTHEAVLTMKQAEYLAEDMELPAFKWYLYSVLGDVNDNVGNYTQTLRYYKQALAEARKSRNEAWMVQTLNNIATTFDLLGLPDSLKHYTDLAQPYAPKTDGEIRATYLVNKASYLLSLGKRQEAKQLLNESMRYTPIDRASKLLADIYMKEGDTEAAAQQWYRLTNSFSPDVSIQSYRLLIQYLNRKGDKDQALEYSQRLNEVYQKLYERSDAAGVIDMQVQYDEQQKERRQYRTTIALLAAIILIAIGATIIIRYSRRRIDMLNARFLESQQKYDLTRSELTQMRHQKEREMKENSQQLKEVISRLHATANKGRVADDDDLNALAQFSYALTPDLQVLLSTLNTKEQAVCLLIRHNFQPTEIAALTLSTPQTITNTRVRLLKKLFGQTGGAKDFDVAIKAFMKKGLMTIALVLLAVSPAFGEGIDSLQICLQQGDSCMQQYNTFEALKHYQQAFEMVDTLQTRTKLADCYYKRGNYRQTSELLKLVPEDSLTHESFRQLALSYQKQSDTDSYIYWAGRLLGRFPMDGEMVAGLTLAYAKNNQPQNGIVCGMKYSLKDSTNILVNRALADAWFMNRDFTAASKLYERLLQQGDSTFNTLYSAGMCYTRLDSLERAYKYLQLAFLISGMQHQGCAYRLGVVCNDLKSYDEGLGYLKLATEMMQPDTTIMKAITLSQGEGYYMTKQYDKAIEAWKRHLEYNPGSVATYYNIASAYYYFSSDVQQSKAYLEKFLEVARKEEKPTQQLKDMIDKAETLLRTTNFNSSRKTKTK